VPRILPCEIEPVIKAVEADMEVNNSEPIHKAEFAGIIANLKDLVVRIEKAERIR
jgi:hypothetical protein